MSNKAKGKGSLILGKGPLKEQQKQIGTQETALELVCANLQRETHELFGRRDQTAEYGKCTPEIFFVKSNCTPEKGCGTLEFGCGSIVEAFILPQ